MDSELDTWLHKLPKEMLIEIVKKQSFYKRYNERETLKYIMLLNEHLDFLRKGGEVASRNPKEKEDRNKISLICPIYKDQEVENIVVNHLECQGEVFRKTIVLRYDLVNFHFICYPREYVVCKQVKMNNYEELGTHSFLNKYPEFTDFINKLNSKKIL